MEVTKPTVREFPVMQEHFHSWSEYQLYQSVPQWLVSSQNALYSPLEGESLRNEVSHQNIIVLRSQESTWTCCDVEVFRITIQGWYALLSCRFYLLIYE